MRHKETFNHKDGVTLRDYFDSRFEEVEKATLLANRNLEARLDSLNEWRLQNKDERGQYATRSEVDLKIEAMEKSRRDSIALVIAIFGLLIGAIGIIIGLIGR